jgi:hypothetical protein
VITVKIEGIAGVQERLRRIADDMRGPVMQAAINKTADKAQAEINRAIRDEYAVKPDEVRNAITIRKAQKGNLEAIVRVFGSKNKRGRSLNMIHFLAAAQAAGVAVKTRGAKGVKKKDLAALGKQLGFAIKKGGGLKQIEGAFVGNKGRTIFQRTGNGRLPIKPVQVIGFGQMFASRKIHDRVLAKINADLPVEIDRAIKMIIARSR